MTRKPEFSELPLRPGDPPLSAWGLYGPEDQLGTLNLLTEQTVLSAVSEIVSGKSFSLNLPLNVPKVSMNPLRKPCRHTFNIKERANDDELDINTQSSTHWDGLRHVPYQSAKLFYNGVGQDSISGENPDLRLGIHSEIALDIGEDISRKTIVGRGVLLDYRAWAEQNSVEYDAFTNHRISLSELISCAKAQHVSFRPGDILVIRSGWTKDYYKRSSEEKVLLGTRSNRYFVGVENTLEMAKWHWDMQFAAVAGDTNAYEAWPPNRTGSLGAMALHEVFLAGWGMPIGELWNLEALSEACRESGRWSFFLVSQPLDIPGGVASPSNVTAIM